MQTRRRIAEEYCLISKIEPNNVNEACNVEQSDGFQLTDKEDMVFRLKKALYRLKQAPGA